MSITIEELKARFPTQTIAPHSECVVVPGEKFDPDWEFQLEDQGYKVHLVELNRRPRAPGTIKEKAASLAPLFPGRTRARIVGDPQLVDKISEVILANFELAEDMQTFDHAVGRDYSHTSAPGITYYLTIKKPKERSE